MRPHPTLQPWVYGAPAAAGVLVFALYRIFYRAAAIDRLHLPIDAGAWQDVAALSVAAENLVARMTWGLSAMVFVLAWLAAVGGTLWVIAGATADRPLRVKVLWLGLGAALGTLGLGWAYQDPLTLPRVKPILVHAFEALEMEAGPYLLHLFTGMAVGAAMLLLVASSATLAGPASAADPGDHLKAQVGRLRRILYLGAGVLVAGTLQTAATHQLPVTLLAEGSARSFQLIARSISTSTGAVWTLLLLAIYLPSAFVLRQRALGLAEEAQRRGQAESVEGWFGRLGLESSFTQHLARLSAILGPLVTGGPVAALLNLLGG